MSDEEEQLKENWIVSIQCVDCKVEFKVTGPRYSTRTLHQGEGNPKSRMIIINVPNQCPDCNNTPRGKLN